MVINPRWDLTLTRFKDKTMKANKIYTVLGLIAFVIFVNPVIANAGWDRDHRQNKRAEYRQENRQENRREDRRLERSV